MARRCKVDGIGGSTTNRKVPALGDCDTMSFVSAIVQYSTAGWNPAALGHAYLLPFGNKTKVRQKRSLIIGYREWSTLPAVPDRLYSLSARVVREGTISASSLVWKEMVHRPGESEDAQVTHVYAVARLNRSLPTGKPN
ncbi:recombinase RecT [Salmonella enterica subsp. enterica serovar Weltevreden]|nr:recombinase RecT [Salmonella enterica subsp. enterica serovar Weltevreden]